MRATPRANGYPVMHYLISTLLLVQGLAFWAMGLRMVRRGWVTGKFGTVYTREYTPINFWTQAGFWLVLGTACIGGAFALVIAKLVGAD